MVTDIKNVHKLISMNVYTPTFTKIPNLISPITTYFIRICIIYNKTVHF